MKAHHRTPSSKRRQQSNGIASLPEVEKFQHLSLHCQKRRPRATFLLALLVVLVTLVGVANLVAPRASHGVDVQPILGEGFHPMRNRSHNSHPHPQQHRPKAQGRYHREISVVDSKDVVDQESFSSPTQQPSVDDEAPRWTPEQLEEMNRYYKRYLEVFFEKHGDEYEPEPKEVVYTEYLAFKERKHREHRERKAAEQQKRAAEQQRQQQLQQQQQQRDDREAQAEENRNETMDAPSSPIADHIMIKPTPYDLEMDVAPDDLDQVEQELYYSASNNATFSIVATTPTTIVVSMQ